jgi:SpoVK/Ycf46/Vps4 family AAA+-type ATPase
MHVERLITLFQAFRERNEDAFYRAAEAVIADELAANHHAEARELRSALRAARDERPSPRPVNGLSILPKDRKNGESLVAVIEPHFDANRVMLDRESRGQIDRVLHEHFQRGKLSANGYRPKSKLLFWGPPGCGKTLTAHLVASELQLPLGVVRLNSLITSFLGETASNIQRVFDMVQSTPMVLLIDEADAIAKDRDDSNDVGELKRVVNSLLQAMDTFTAADSIVIAASNHQYLLDNALWRRFDDVVFFPPPSPALIKKFLQDRLNGVKVTGEFDMIVKSAASLSFAEIERGVIEAVKTMILSDRVEMRSAEIAAQFKAHRNLLKRARAKRADKTT